MNTMLKKLHNRETQAKKQNNKMAEYRVNLKRATVDSIKCMYEEYIRRKQNTLSAHRSDACYREIGRLDVFLTPAKSGDRCWQEQKADGVTTSDSPLAVPLE